MTGAVNAEKMTSLAYTQSWKGKPNSAIEAIIRKEEISDFKTDSPRLWLETCGTHSAANCSIAVVADVAKWIARFTTPGGALMRPPDVLAIWMNEPKNAAALEADFLGVDFDDVMANEYRQIYPLCVKNVFGIKARFEKGSTWASVVSELKAGHSVMLGLHKDWNTGKPLGHFIGAYAYDETKNEIVYADPADYRHPAGDFANAGMGEAEFNATVTDSVVVFEGEI